MKLITALATPFKNGKIDFGSYEKLLQRQIGVADALLCCGTTGESGMLLEKEKQILLEKTKSVGLPVWTGVGGATESAVLATKSAKNCGADGVLVTPPSFFKCTQQGYVEHILRIADIGLPVMLYNAPSRCGYTLWEEAVFQLSARGVCLKDAGGNLEYAKTVAKHTTVLCGDDEKTEKYISCGVASGLVSVVSNLFPHLTKQILLQTANDGQREIFREISRLAFCEINPIPIKYALWKAGIFETFDVRLPLTKACAETRNNIDKFFEKYPLENAK